MKTQSAAHPAANLSALLASEHDAIAAFTKLLQDEQQSLLHGEAERLLDFADRKSVVLLKLKQLGSIRNQCLAGQGLPADRDGVRAWLARNADPSAEKSWDTLLRNADSARQLNETNGIIIRARLRHNQQALAALSGAVLATSLYGPDGGARLSAHGRRFGAA